LAVTFFYVFYEGSTTTSILVMNIMNVLRLYVLFLGSTQALRIGPSFKDNGPSFKDDLARLGFTEQYPVVMNAALSKIGAARSRKVFIVDTGSRAFIDMHILNFGNGSLKLSSNVMLPKSEVAVVVAMAHPRATRGEYELLENLANDFKNVQVIIHCTEWDLSPGSAADAILAHRNPRWTIIVDPESVAGKGTEHVRYLQHIALFFDQISPLNFFIHDDAEDQVLVGNGPKQSHAKQGTIVNHIREFMEAKTKPSFMYVLDKVSFLQNISRIGDNRQSGNARCTQGEHENPPTSRYDIFRYHMEHVLLPERRGHIPLHVDVQNSAHFAVSAERIREVLPSADAYGRIIQHSSEAFYASKCDHGGNFEISWPFLFSMCDESMRSDNCMVDRGSCKHVGNDGLGKGLAHILCEK